MKYFLAPVSLVAGSLCATESPGDNSTKIASTAYVDAAVAAGGGGGGATGNVPQVIQHANATFALTDLGKHWIKTNTTGYTWTIPPNSSVAFAIGDTILVVNDNSTGNITIARGSGVTLINGNTNANYTLVPGQVRTLLKIGTDRWKVI